MPLGVLPLSGPHWDLIQKGQTHEQGAGQLLLKCRTLAPLPARLGAPQVTLSSFHPKILLPCSPGKKIKNQQRLPSPDSKDPKKLNGCSLPSSTGHQSKLLPNTNNPSRSCDHRHSLRRWDRFKSTPIERRITRPHQLQCRARLCLPSSSSCQPACCGGLAGP